MAIQVVNDPLGSELEEDYPVRLSMPDMQSILGPGGVISERLPGYEPRQSQIEVAQAVADAIKATQPLLAEAGTGTGKSLAYLIPSVYSCKKVIVSTEGKALQDQLAKKDLPFLRSVLPVPFTFAVLKGIGNYVCLDKLAEWTSTLLGMTDEMEVIGEWADQTETGDLADAPVSPSPELHSKITCSSDDCLRNDCPQSAKCFYLWARGRAEDADILVVNHTLLALDLAIRDKTDDGVSILPDRDIIIIDEAHTLEDVATKAFTVEATSSTIRLLLRGRNPSLAELPEDEMEKCQGLSDRLFALLATNQLQSYTITSPTPEMRTLGREIGASLRRLRRVSEQTKLVKEGAEAKRLERYSNKLENWADVFEDTFELTRETHVLYVERTITKRGAELVSLKLAPISVADDLASALWQKWTVVATSATLTTHGNFDYFRERCGCPSGDVRQCIVDSPFDYRRNAVLYLPPNGSLFDPTRYYQGDSIEYFDRLAGEIEQLLLASDGRAFVLFTSRKALEEVFSRLHSRLRWNVLKQGDASPQELVRRFKADGHSVLFGLRTFWAGVDVQGEALSLVIVDKLPFPTPDEPVYQARCDKLNRDSGDRWAWFRRLALPLCAIQFKQGFGRLIRTKSDRGVVALLDGRLTTKGYGSGIIRSLPPATQTRSIEAVRTFYATGEVVEPRQEVMEYPETKW